LIEDRAGVFADVFRFFLTFRLPYGKGESQCHANGFLDRPPVPTLRIDHGSRANI